MAPKSKSEPAGNVVAFKIKGDGRLHYGSRTAPLVTKGVEDGTVTIVEEVAPDAPTISRASDAANSGPAAS
jgi:hypothetical protein